MRSGRVVRVERPRVQRVRCPHPGAASVMQTFLRKARIVLIACSVRGWNGRTSGVVGIGPTGERNVRRVLAPLFVTLAVWCAPLDAQSALAIGYAGTLGDNWQIEALEVGLVVPTGLGPVRSAVATARIGWFGDQGAIIGGTRGFIGGGALAVRSGRLKLFEVGQDASPTVVALDLTLEVAGYLASRAPAPWSPHAMSLAVLPGIRVGPSGGSQFSVLAGPAWFGDHVWHGHAFVAARFEVPLAQGRGGP